jgi:hypothetical protein
MKAVSSFAILGCALGLASCNATDFDPASRVTTLRVLSVEADQPYAHPGENVTLSGLSYDPQGRSLQWAWAACVNPRASTVEGCLAKLAEDANNGQPPMLMMGADLDRVTFPIPDDTISSLAAVAQPSALVGVVSATCPGQLDLDQDSDTLPFRCVDNDSGRALALDEYVVGLKRIAVRSSDRNQNPIVARLTFDGADWPEDEIPEVDACNTNKNDWLQCTGGARHKLAAYATPESFESGVNEFGQPFAEQLIVEYYATEGIFEYDVRIAGEPETRWAARTQARGSDVHLWFVLRDDRGGVTHAERTIRVR